MSRIIQQSNRFKRQFRLMKRRGKNEDKLLAIVKLLAQDKPLPASKKDHPLIGNYSDCRECHIEPDWLLVYRLTADMGLELVETGSHSDLFGK